MHNARAVTQSVQKSASEFKLPQETRRQLLLGKVEFTEADPGAPVPIQKVRQSEYFFLIYLRNRFHFLSLQILPKQ